jgi:hypothetical protein
VLECPKSGMNRDLGQCRGAGVPEAWYERRFGSMQGGERQKPGIKRDLGRCRGTGVTEEQL